MQRHLLQGRQEKNAGEGDLVSSVTREIILARREPGGSARVEKLGIIGQYGPRLFIIGRGYRARWSNKSVATTGLPKREFSACCRRHKCGGRAAWVTKTCSRSGQCRPYVCRILRKQPSHIDEYLAVNGKRAKKFFARRHLSESTERFTWRRVRTFQIKLKSPTSLMFVQTLRNNNSEIKFTRRSFRFGLECRANFFFSLK